MELTHDDLKSVAEDLDVEVEDFRTDYSGRAMYDDECVGLVAKAGPGILVQIAFSLKRIGYTEDDITEMMDSTRTDSMGQSEIYYWPNTTIASG